MNLYSLAFGIGTKDSADNWLECYYPAPILAPEANLQQAILPVLEYSGGNQSIELDQQQINQILDNFGASQNQEQIDLLSNLTLIKKPIVICILENDSSPTSVPEVYLKLHLLSHRLVQPHGLNLDGMFGLLPNVAWTNKGAIAITELAQQQLIARRANETLSVNSVDKFPKMTDYIVPSGVRIADTSRVRLGAYIGEGTTIMHEGFVNFNAGTAGEAMIEGRISAGVFVGKGSDLGGGCSIMGTLSGGGKETISIGENCLIAANSQIFDGSGHEIFLDDPAKRIFTSGTVKPIKIGNNCWLGTSVIILPGSKLGNNCIVAAGSVVNEEFKDNSLIGGNPAKFIKSLK